MTENEYIQSIRDTAERYIEAIGSPAAHKDTKSRIYRWQAVKEHLSAQTAIDLCDCWLDAHTRNTHQDRGSAPPSGEETTAADNRSG